MSEHDVDVEAAEREVAESSRRLGAALDRLGDRIGESAVRVGDIIDRVRHPGETLGFEARKVFDEAKMLAGDTWYRARDVVQPRFVLARDRASRTIREYPVATGVGVFAISALIGIGLRAWLEPKRVPQAARLDYIDRCIARWAFERTGVKLYEEAIAKCPHPGLKARLLDIRDEEKRHEEMLEGVIRAHGFDPHSQGEPVRLTLKQSQGVVDTVMTESFDGALEALLTAELVDAGGWELLVKLARRVGDEKAEKHFVGALAEEAKHLLFLRQVVANSAP